MDVNVHSQSLDCNRGTGMVRDRIHRDRISFSYIFLFSFFPSPFTSGTNHTRKRKKTLSNKFKYARVYEKLTLAA